jgi:DTW domain-containing protein YfiP
MIFLDASWYQVPVIRRDARLQHIPTISLDNYVTDYWRPQTGHNDSHLATVEAVYYALREYHLIVSSNYHGQFDDLLFWFYYFRDMVMRVK